MLFVPGTAGPLLVIVPIATYTAVLIYAQASLYTRLNVTLKDSPYFLGFMLTLTGLIKVFLGLRTGAGPVAGGTIVAEAAGAIIATLVGLLGRQMTHSFDPSDDTRDALFDSLVDEMRDQADKLRTAQARFSGFLLEFTTAREAQFAREEQALERWISNIEMATVGVERVASIYPPAVDRLLEDASALGRAFADARQEVETDFGTLRVDLRTHIEQAGRLLNESVTEHVRGLGDARGALQRNLADLVNAAADGSRDLREHVTQLGNGLAEVQASSHRIARSLAVTEAAADTARAALQSLAETAGGVGTELGRDLRAAGADTRDALAKQMRTIATDVAAVDQLLTDVVDLLKERYELAGKPPAV